MNTNHFQKPIPGLTSCLEDFLKDPNFFNINWRTMAIMDKQTGERTPLSEITEIKQKVKYIFYRYGILK
jgi:hypothetical protein